MLPQLWKEDEELVVEIGQAGAVILVDGKASNLRRLAKVGAVSELYFKAHCFWLPGGVGWRLLEYREIKVIFRIWLLSPIEEMEEENSGESFVFVFLAMKSKLISGCIFFKCWPNYLESWKESCKPEKSLNILFFHQTRYVYFCHI